LTRRSGRAYSGGVCEAAVASSAALLKPRGESLLGFGVPGDGGRAGGASQPGPGASRGRSRVPTICGAGGTAPERVERRAGRRAAHRGLAERQPETGK